MLNETTYTGVPLPIGIHEADREWTQIANKLVDTHPLVRRAKDEWNRFVFARSNYEKAYKAARQCSSARYISPLGEFQYMQAHKAENREMTALMQAARLVKERIRILKAHPECFIEEKE